MTLDEILIWSNALQLFFEFSGFILSMAHVLFMYTPYGKSGIIYSSYLLSSVTSFFLCSMCFLHPITTMISCTPVIFKVLCLHSLVFCIQIAVQTESSWQICDSTPGIFWVQCEEAAHKFIVVSDIIAIIRKFIVLRDAMSPKNSNTPENVWVQWINIWKPKYQNGKMRGGVLCIV